MARKDLENSVLWKHTDNFHTALYHMVILSKKPVIHLCQKLETLTLEMTVTLEIQVFRGGMHVMNFSNYGV